MLKAITRTFAVMGLALGATFIAPADRVEAAGFGSQSCGGLGQKTCISFNKEKRCNSGLIEKKQSGRNICVRPSSAADTTGGCGGLNQKTCISINRNKRCDAGLVEKRQGGRNICVRPSSPGDTTGGCGGLNQNTCISMIASKRCDAGLLEKKQDGRNICVRPSSPGDTTGGCGGLNENTCINLIASKRCDAGLVEIRQRGRNICVKDEMGVDTTPGCGGIGQNSCWSLKASQWCDAGLLYKPGGIPGRGRCEAPDEDDMLQYTRSVTSRFFSLNDSNEVSRLRECLTSPARLSRLKAQMSDQDSNGINGIIRECAVNVERLQQVAEYVLNPSNNSAARSLGVSTANATSDDANDSDSKLRLFFEYSTGGAAGSASATYTIGYALPLHRTAKGSRFYEYSDDYQYGFDLGAGMDFLIGFGFPGIPEGDYVQESGKAGVIGGALGLKAGVMTRVTREGRRPSWGIFAGGGLGATMAISDYTNQFLEDKPKVFGSSAE